MHDPHLHLFVDDAEVYQRDNLSRIVNQPRKHPAPVLVSDRPWECGRVQAWGSVIREPDGRFRLWYFALNARRAPGTEQDGGYCYAESRDGVHWEKPDLGLVEWRGRRDNNLFFTFSPDGKNRIEEALAKEGQGLAVRDRNGRTLGVVNNMDGLTVVRDDEEPDPQKRYKLIANMQDHRMWAPCTPNRYPNVTAEQVEAARTVFGQYLLTSPDGLHWTQSPHRLVRAESGDYMMVVRDHRNRRWWLNERPRSFNGRCVGLRYSPDLETWTDPVTPIFINDEDTGFGKFWEWHGMTPFNYGNQDLGFLEKWSGFGDGFELVSHRDGEPWRRVAPNCLFLNVGPEGAFDRFLAYPTHNPPIVVGEQIFIYYSGAPVKTDPESPLAFSIGLATIGLDRFAGLVHHRGPAGRVLTSPRRIEHDQLQVNTETLIGPGVRVEIQNPDGAACPGYGLDECMPLFGNLIRRTVRWKDRRNLSELRGRTVQLLFEVQGAVLYAYRFTEGDPA